KKRPNEIKLSDIERAVHAAGEAGFFPLDERWHIRGSQYSDSLSKQMVWLSGLVPYRQVVQVFERIGQRVICQSNLWRETQAQGTRLQAELNHQRTVVAPERVVVGQERDDHDMPKGVSMDGGMVNIRGEGWKEFKAGVVYDVALRPGKDPQTREAVDLPCIEARRYTAVLGEVGQFAPALWAIAVAHELPRAARSSVTADGAEWIWNVTADLFPDSTQIVDWYHATQHLVQAAHALFAEDEIQANKWYRSMQTPLFRGDIWRITRPLLNANLAAHARYFEHHQRRMRYQESREQGWLIGSGPVESEIKQFKVRLTGPGMRWSRPHAERMLVIRTAVLSDDFDTLWAVA
ncbi:MAG: hypothetical protein GX604_05035, partial [Actinobacteria bacterium]|nr:hypothetical protein [Actinomycetota bacterium]